MLEFKKYRDQEKIIEAMKLENEVPSTCEGIVKEVKVSKGSTVNNNDILVVLG